MVSRGLVWGASQAHAHARNRLLATARAPLTLTWLSFALVTSTDTIRKIDEPKTPYVRYDAENDVVLGIGGGSRPQLLRIPLTRQRFPSST